MLADIIVFNQNFNCVRIADFHDIFNFCVVNATL